MIELRWIKRVTPAPQYGPDIAMTEKVLQQRVIYKAGEYGNDGFLFDYETWTDWTDVPTVDDGGK